MHEHNHTTENEMPPTADDQRPKEAAPTDFRKHFWLLVAILGTVIIAGVIARIWAIARTVPDQRPEQDHPPVDQQR